jgi:hypothetical protein
MPPRRKYKTNTAQLNAKTRKNAFRSGMAWDGDEVSKLVSGIERDKTSYEMALDLNRTLYGVMNARAHVAFAMRWQHVIAGHHAPARRVATSQM